MAGGSPVAEVLADLDRRYPGLRFRIVEDLSTPVTSTDELHVIGALSGR